VTDYLTLAEVLAMHEDLIARYGGSPGIRDLGLLEAALFRPQTGYYADIIAEAAALWESLSQNHPFVDGNKRVAFAAVYTFLRANGITLMANADVTFTFISGLYQTGTFRFDHLESWLRAHTAYDSD
jgi:death-on-curing protein